MSYLSARLLHAVVAVMALVGVTMEVVMAFTDGPGTAGSMAERLTRLFSSFSIDSTILIGTASAVLAARPKRDGQLFRLLRVSSVLCIAVTGIVYHVALRGIDGLTPAGELSDVLLHTGVPMVAVLAWMLVGPRPRLSWSTVGWAFLPPLVWIACTFTRGAVVAWYPYPFLDVTTIGYASVALNTAVVAAVFLVLGTAALTVESRLAPAPRLGWARSMGPAGQSGDARATDPTGPMPGGTLSRAGPPGAAPVRGRPARDGRWRSSPRG